MTQWIFLEIVLFHPYDIIREYIYDLCIYTLFALCLNSTGALSKEKYVSKPILLF